jgi:hypothetical protein
MTYLFGGLMMIPFMLTYLGVFVQWPTLDHAGRRETCGQASTRFGCTFLEKFPDRHAEYSGAAFSNPYAR